ncbi:hypothetical protein A6R68_11159, partial [Neotoma lepida]
MEVYIPSFRHEDSDLERGYTLLENRIERSFQTDKLKFLLVLTSSCISFLLLPWPEFLVKYQTVVMRSAACPGTVSITERAPRCIMQIGLCKCSGKLCLCGGWAGSAEIVNDVLSNAYLKKCIKTPEIPSKHVRNWVPKVLEQRRQGLETYLQDQAEPQGIAATSTSPQTPSCKSTQPELHSVDTVLAHGLTKHYCLQA